MGLHVPFAPYRLVFFFFFALKQYLIIYLEESLRPIKLKKTKQNIQEEWQGYNNNDNKINSTL